MVLPQSDGKSYQNNLVILDVIAQLFVWSPHPCILWDPVQYHSQNQAKPITSHPQLPPGAMSVIQETGTKTWGALKTRPGKLRVCYWKWSIEIVDLPIKVVIFHSYASLPEGNGVGFRPSHPVISLHLITSHYISLHLITSHYISLHLITSHYISLHLITLVAGHKHSKNGWWKSPNCWVDITWPQSSTNHHW